MTTHADSDLLQLCKVSHSITANADLPRTNMDIGSATCRCKVGEEVNVVIVNNHELIPQVLTRSETVGDGETSQEVRYSLKKICLRRRSCQEAWLPDKGRC